MGEEYAVQVIFPQGGYWSKRYTYLSSVPFKKHDVVTVPRGPFHSVGKVAEIVPASQYKFEPNVNYLRITGKVDLFHE
jgi:hypothetical protein